MTGSELGRAGGFIAIALVVVGAMFVAGLQGLGPGPSAKTSTTLGPDIYCAAGTPADCSFAMLRNADFTGFNLTGANFTGADLRFTKFNFATLVNATFTGANVTGADFSFANLTGSIISAASLQSAVVCNTVLPNGADVNMSCPA